MQRLHAGGSLNYLDEAFNFIKSEEAKRPNQKLTELEKNRLALKYAQLMSDNDVKNGLVESYKIDTEAGKRKQEKKKARKDLRLEYIEKQLEKRWEAEKRQKREKEERARKRNAIIQQRHELSPAVARVSQ